MENFSSVHLCLGHFLIELREKSEIPIARLCADSGVSTRTYAKLVKHLPVKPECYVRLVAGICKGATPEEFKEFWERFGEWIYATYSEL